MIDCRFKVLVEWPGNVTPSHARKASPFKAGWQKTLDLLERELEYLRAKDISVEGFFRSSDIRNDGWPKSSARPERPGIILSFETKHGRMMMPCDRYADREANIRAIALTLEHLRAAERYGVVTEKHEQYSGWVKIGPANGQVEIDGSAKTLLKFACLNYDILRVTNDQEVFDSVWREAARRTHPDRNGNAGDFRQVIAARDRLKELRGWQ